MKDFAAVNKIYEEYFPKNAPARATFAVAGLPRGAKVEIEAIARVKGMCPVPFTSCCCKKSKCCGSS